MPETSNTALYDFPAISLEAISRVSLFSRMEFKFLLPPALLPTLLSAIPADHFILEYDGKRLLPYHTRYFDTEDFRLYLDHHNGKANRLKVRCRVYEQSGDCFLELKRKHHEVRSEKMRIAIPVLPEALDLSRYPELAATHLFPVALQSCLDNHFRRITFCDPGFNLRITIDTGICWNAGNNKQASTDRVIIEIKQSGNNQHPLHYWLRRNHIRETAFSKYAIGAALLHPQLKNNNFKPVFHKLRPYAPADQSFLSR